MPVYEFGVAMSCNSCSNAVNRVLTRTDDVKNIDISLEDQKVVVETDLDYQTVHDKIAKTGKKINYGKTIS